MRFRAIFSVLADVVIAQVLDPATVQQILGSITGIVV
jgi:hypothetical protein